MRTYRSWAAVAVAALSLVSLRAEAEGVDFAAQAKLLYRVAACGGDDAVPDKFDAKLVTSHCKELRETMDEYKKKWVDQAKPYLANLVPKDLPKVVVYPFGGGDLLTTLSTFPDATEITTLSLEKSGDARMIDNIAKAKFKTELDENRKDVGRLFKVAHSKTTNLEIVSRGHLPGELVFSLVALVVHDYEPLTLRYFKLADDGSIKYITAEEIAAADKDAKLRKGMFDNMEVTFRAKGQANAPVKTFRHIAANLDNKHFKASPVQKHLVAKGKVSAMTKAASFLLWWSDFSTIREYLLENMEWMISDATGVPPRYATKAGFEQITYGKFDGPFLAEAKGDGTVKEMTKLWKTNPQVELGFRYGYPDNAHHSHMMITRRVKK
jgi:hypothetical protein